MVDKQTKRKKFLILGIGSFLLICICTLIVYWSGTAKVWDRIYFNTNVADFENFAANIQNVCQDSSFCIEDVPYYVPDLTIDGDIIVCRSNTLKLVSFKSRSGSYWYAYLPQESASSIQGDTDICQGYSLRCSEQLADTWYLCSIPSID